MTYNDLRELDLENVKLNDNEICYLIDYYCGNMSFNIEKYRFMYCLLSSQRLSRDILLNKLDKLVSYCELIIFTQECDYDIKLLYLEHNKNKLNIYSLMRLYIYNKIDISLLSELPLI